MKRRPWVIKPPLVAAILAGLAMYAVVGEVLGVHLLGPRTPRQSVLSHHLWEFMFLWWAACIAVGWIQYLRRQRPERAARSWPLVIVTFAMAIILAAAEGWSAYAEPLDTTHGAIPFSVTPLGSSLIFAALSLALAFAISVTLVSQAFFWRRPATLGVCSVCDYDLTGNVSGTCPECGTRIVTDPSIPRWFHARNHRWLPELSLFPDAEVRYKAWQNAMRHYRRTSSFWVGTLAAFLFVACLVLPFAERLGLYRWPAVVVLACIALAETWHGRRMFRRALRRQLDASGREH